MILPIDTVNLIWLYCVKEVLNWIHPKLDYSEHWTILISDILKSMTPYWLLPPPTQEKDDNIDSFDEEQEDDDDDNEYHQFDPILIHRKTDIMTPPILTAQRSRSFNLGTEGYRIHCS